MCDPQMERESIPYRQIHKIKEKNKKVDASNKSGTRRRLNLSQKIDRDRYVQDFTLRCVAED